MPTLLPDRGGPFRPPCVALSRWVHRALTDAHPLEPLSRTAVSITGPVRVTTEAISFNGKPVPARLEGRYWRAWSSDDKKHTGSVYTLQSGPGKLRHGSTLCGNDRARYVVLWQENDDLLGPAIGMAVFASATPPANKDSDGLCGTYS